MKSIIPILLAAMLAFPVLAQQSRDKGKLIQSKNLFYEKILSELDRYNQSKTPPVKEEKFEMDFESRTFPTDLSRYTTQWHNPPESQGATNTCWSFSTVSFLESDLFRLRKIRIKLSQLFVVYHEYLEKASLYVQSRGKSLFAEGSEANAVTRIIKKYGIIPYADYTGLLPGQPFHDHRALYDELNGYMENVKKSGAWNPDQVLATTRAILNRHIGTPPASVLWKGKAYSPLAFSREILQLDPDAYVDLLSCLQQPFWKQVEYPVPDNWWLDKSYYNLPLDDYMKTLKKVVKAGYTVSIGGDVSEPGYNFDVKVGIIPSFDIPREYIDDYARQFRFSNSTTTDDHGIHIVGWAVEGNDMWFAVKDSGSGSFCKEPAGYRFVREDFIKLKWMGFMVHRDAVAEILKKFPAQ